MKRVILTFTFALAACGGGSGSTTPSRETGSCCINGSYYTCPSSAAATDCFNNRSPGSCSRDSSKDSTCS